MVLALWQWRIAVGREVEAVAALQEKERAEADKERAEVENDRKRAATLVDALLVAPAEGVPYVIQSLEPFREQSFPLLLGQFENTTLPEGQRLHVALALAAFGEVKTDCLVESVATAPAEEAGNLLTALRPVQVTAISSLRERFKNERDPQVKARQAITLLHLGQPDGAQTILALAADPAERTALIHGLDQWHDALADYLPFLQNSEDSAFRSGLCLALGRIPQDALPPAAKQKLVPLLLELYQNASDGATHSASGWALRQWEVELPEIKSLPESGRDRDWYVNKLGMTMLRMPAGSFARVVDQSAAERTTQTVTLTRPFYLCDREVTVEQFEQFLNDADYPVSEKPQDRTERSGHLRPTKDCPVAEVNWFDAVLYCNWLSQREGLTPCYSRTAEAETAEAWELVPNANGYRLPSEAEWEYACRAGTITDYCSGNDVSLVEEYGWWAGNANERSWPVASKLPNGWGLFDVHGNAWEWCQDWYGPYPVQASIKDPLGAAKGSGRVLRGGSFFTAAAFLRSALRNIDLPDFRFNDSYGFRPARTYP